MRASPAQKQLGKLQLRKYLCWIDNGMPNEDIIVDATNGDDAQRLAAIKFNVPEFRVTVGQLEFVR